ncbi:SDR family NAD(P)-dependent oxidoreductase [Microlunatus speluncae]|uniref:SDR family NAD(P)-dependent oxidoreductase n=1 Tax=Microlunatus speluncae TaxID=2594267 RepID=UPI001266771D|nr:SDR family oxidoreductase [Microlunatus speluncae]
MTGRLADRNALITGASRGIGAAVARRFAAEGARVIIAHQPTPERTAEAEAVAAEIRADGGRAEPLPADLADPAAIARLVERAAATWGGLDIVVANAAYETHRAWLEITAEEWDLTQAVNVRGTFLLARESHSHLRASAHPSFIALTSVMVDTGMVGALHYTTSKAAIIGLVRALAREIGPEGIRVNAIMPGAIRTENEVAHNPDPAAAEQRILPLQSLQRRGYADDLAGAFVFLAGDDSDFITGQIITVDGGWVLR